MAFKNARLAVTTSYSAIYTCPENTVAVVIGLQAANIDGTANADITVQWRDASASNVSTLLANTVTVPADASIGLLAGKLVLEAGDNLRALASANGDIDLTASILEIAV